MSLDSSFPWATAMAVLITIMVGVVGGIAVVMDDLDFNQYIAALTGLAIGNGLLGIGRGVAVKNNPPPPPPAA